MKLRKLAVVAIAGALALSACGKEGDSGTDEPTSAVESAVAVSGSKTFDAIKQRGKVIIGVKEDQPNLGYKDPTTNEYSGFDISMAKLIAAKLGYGDDKIEYKAIPSANREQAIVNGDIDYYVGTYSITDKRKTQISFAGPYYVAGQDLLVRKDDTSITGPETLAGKTVCSVTGSTSIQRIKEEYKQAKTVEFEKYSQCVDGLLNKQVDAVTTDDAILKGYAAQQPDKLKVVGKPFSEEKYGVGLNKDDSALRGKINDIIEASAKDGEWKKIYDATLGKSGSDATPPALERY
ncbi:glutamate ABC transporter substrate-binding protein [Cryptosporangium aurantiacum]|uniref:Amino acid ABC transporter substrate-binding protein, PAAT family n=1 Tax=Cryptosporangium aurantiacum TaxID=134849 RepID=A0A1M7IVY8_9ACTN|nr:glutamate ABC transporter substrate-binding protein [Cryptosporangium aurantiacum]SHM44868.1 amino acid ABC transporter substrate-binding protein, PAAT family [Cryptosporangium aurantiacum]